MSVQQELQMMVVEEDLAQVEDSGVGLEGRRVMVEYEMVEVDNR